MTPAAAGDTYVTSTAAGGTYVTSTAAKDTYVTSAAAATLVKNTETSGVYCMNPHKELIIQIKDTVIQYPNIVPVSSHIPTHYVLSMIPNT